MALVPSDISSSLQAAGGGLSEIFTQASDVVQTVGSMWDTITGKADASKPAAAAAPAPVPAPTPVKETPSMSTQTKYILIGLGIVVLVAFVGVRK